jgi:UbiD family decarboxylase
MADLVYNHQNNNKYLSPHTFSIKDTMSFRNFIDQLRSTGKLIEITHPVSSKFEAPRIAKEKGAPILFHDVDGKKAVMNLLGSSRLMVRQRSYRIHLQKR